MDGGDTGWLKVERAGVERRRTGREHNVSHSARSCIFYDMASNLTSRARHNSRPCGSCVCMCVCGESFLVFPTRYIARRGIGTCTRVYTRARTHARTHEESPHARVCARDRYALRPSTSKPLEVEALRKYNASRRNLPLSVFTDIRRRDIYVCTRSERRDAKEMKSREWREKKRQDETTRARKRGERRRDGRREQLLRRPI